MSFCLRKIDLDDMDFVLKSRNSPDVRKNMYTSHVISREEHEIWYSGMLQDPTKEYFIFEIDSSPAGVVGFIDIARDSKIASWMFYSGDTSRKGIGVKMEYYALEYAFSEMGLYKLCCEVLAFNEPVIKLHKKFGFNVEGILRSQHYKDNIYIDIYRLGMFSEEWEVNKDTLREKYRIC